MNMSFFSRKKKHSEGPSAPTQFTQQPQSPTNPLVSQSQSLEEKQQQSQPVGPWSAHAPPFRLLPSPFLRDSHALSMNATAAGELFLFGGYVQSSKSPGNDLFGISTRDFSTTLLPTSGDVPNPRYGHCAVLISADTLLIWGGRTDFSERNAQSQNHDDSLYLLNLVSREWTRIVVNGPGPGGRRSHTMTVVGSKLFVFGGHANSRRFNDIWALDLNCLKSNPFWESYEPAPRNKKPFPRAGHVAVTTGDRIIIFGGSDGSHYYNDTWSFNILTRKWTESQCTGSIPSPRTSHAAVLIDDVMYVYGGSISTTYLGDLAAMNLSTQRWITFQDMGARPCGRAGHAMACDGTRVFVLGGELLPGALVDEDRPIYVLDTKLLVYPKPDSDTVNHSEKTVQLSQKSSECQPHQPSSSLSNAHATHLVSPFQKTSPEDMDRLASPQVTREPNTSLNSLPWRPMGARYMPRRVPEEDEGEGSTDRAKVVAPDAPSGKETTPLEDGRFIELGGQLSDTPAAQTERNRRIGQLTSELTQAKENAAEEKRRAGLELRELQKKLDESMLSRDHALEQAQSALQKASCAAEANEQSQRELTEMRAELEASKSESAALRMRLADTKNGYSKNNAEVDTDRTPTATGLVNTEENRVVRGLMERVQAMEAEMASLRLNEKSFETMVCRNED